MTLLQVEDLHYSVKPHFWRRERKILRGVDLRVEAGEAFGFLGPNGAGKTTTIKAILGLLEPHSGRISLFDAPPSDPSARARVGFMPEHAYFPEHLSGRELVIHHGRLSGLDKASATRRADELLERVGLRDAGEQHLRTYSKGMLQRVGLAQALVGDPDLVVLDEPMSGLDPVGRYEIREILSGLRAAGKTVFFSTHILPDVEALCDRVGIVVAGQTRQQGRLSELLQDTVARVEISLEANTALSEELTGALNKHGCRIQQRGEAQVIEAADAQAANDAVAVLHHHGIRVQSMHPHRASLEELFVETVPRGPSQEAS